jgi:cyclic-di-AMP phosphodiesterase PgpH
MIILLKTGDKMGFYKRFSPRVIIASKKISRFLIVLLTFFILFAICTLSIIPKKYNLREGDVSPADIKAPRDFVDDAATQSKIDKSVMSIPFQYNKNLNVLKDSVDKAEQYFLIAIEIKSLNTDVNSKVERLKSESPLVLSEEDYKDTLELENKDIQRLSEFLTTNLSKILLQDIRENSEADLRKAQEDLSFYIRNSSITKSSKDLASNIGINLIKPNLYYDEKKTDELKEQAKKQTEPVIIKKDQNIISKGEIVSSQHLYLMSKGGLLKKNSSGDLRIFLGVALIIIISQTIIMLFIYRFRKNIYENNSKFLIIWTILCLTAVITSSINIISSYLVPANFISILILLIFDPLVALAISLPSIVIMSVIVNFNVEAITIYLVGCILSTILLRKSNQRNNIIINGVFVGILNGLAILSIGLINNISILNNLINISYTIAGGIVSSILAIGILPVLEQIFDINTPIKLLELSNPNQQLLKKMLFEAPGTYHHSIIVGNLAEAASEEIGANSLLARVGSYYHDIGKIKRPYFFKENQITNDNPHDKITPKLSTVIITSHVKDGMELAEKYKLPGDVKKIIQQHHGTTLVRYFYVMAMNDGSEKVEEELFRYEGPKPSSKEAAIVLLADSVEAAVRSLSSPTVPDIEKMVRKIVKEKVDDGQLDESDLTLKDLERVQCSFVKVLMGIFHNRIEYPEMNTEDEERKN